jgi:hypothetical protein
MVWSATCARLPCLTRHSQARMSAARWTRVVRPEASREPTTLSCLALQDVCSQGLQFGRPVRGGDHRPQDELREPDG